MILDSWGRYPQTIADVLEPLDASALNRLVQAHSSESNLIARGAGRSYGDSALAAKVISSRFLDSFIALDDESGILHCGSGVSLDSVLKIAIAKELFLPVVPGSKFVTVGGAIAADVHGKNHHKHGSFCDHLVGFNVMLASGEIVYCSDIENSDLFHASCGGMGLTGIVVDAKIRLKKITSLQIERRTLVGENLKDTLSLLEENNDSTYSVAWIDCLAKGDSLGRSLLFLGEHKENLRSGQADSKSSDFNIRAKPTFNVPFSMPSLLLNKFTLGTFNSAYFELKSRLPKQDTTDFTSFFFPLDNIGQWNRLYGKAGFLQYQFVVPTETGFETISQVLTKVSDAGKGSFLSVLKKFGKHNRNWLSFPKEGFTLTLDFKRERSLFPLLDELDVIVHENGGRLYLAKDARMSEQRFKQGYSNWEEFMQLKETIDPKQLFRSLQSDRLGLTTAKAGTKK
ncbi:MAG: FAD-binding protein [Pseudohongiellaceae bacterium]